MRFDIVTLFPDLFKSPLDESILKRAIEKGIIRVGLNNLRDHTHDRHHTVDDYPYGGGSGMVIKAQPVIEAIESLRNNESVVVLLTPRGKPFNQKVAKRLSLKKHIILLCGRYEGVDERAVAYADEEISIGDFVLTGGEIAALAIIDAVSRLVPGVLGSEESADEESFSWSLLEYPHYTRPRVFRGKRVPDVLLSGNHEEIRKWRRKEALRKTLELRPDLLKETKLTEEDLRLIEEITPGEERLHS